MSEDSKQPHSTCRRVLFKASGEFLGSAKGALDEARFAYLAQEILPVWQLGIQIGIVLGGGNIMRGATADFFGISRTHADHIGMLATLINSLTLAEALRSKGIPVEVQAPLSISQEVQPINSDRAIEALAANRIVIFGGGTGNPYFSTDTAAALRALEINADVLIKGTKVDGLFTDDPMKNPAAVYLPRCDYRTVLEQNYKVMDLTAFALCKDNQLPIILFNITQPSHFLRIMSGEKLGTLVYGGIFKW